jgi:hypothetical protein
VNICFYNKNVFIFDPTKTTKTNDMKTVDLKTITNENFETIIKNLIGTDCRIDFHNHNEKHEQIALSLGLTIYTGEVLSVFDEADHAGNYY